VKTILLTGFSLYGGYDFNISQYVVEQLAGTRITGVDIAGVVMPVAYGRDLEAALGAFERYSPDLTVALGQDGEASAIYVEEVAVNHRQAAEESAEIIPIQSEGPAFASTRLDALGLGLYLNQHGHPARVRKLLDSAYLCNHIYYQLLTGEQTRSIPTIFLHLPRPQSKGAERSRGYPGEDDVKDAVRTALEWLATRL
jgi:pyroglutamyl-peptidase